MDFKERDLRMVHMKKLQFYIVGMHLTDLQTICCLNFKDIQTITKIHSSPSKL
jgi:hypothetical protein